MSLTHAAFAIAGLIAAAGPVIIHLLNRRRFRTVEWGAMAFLRKAMQRRRKAVRLRDLLLLVLRTAALLLFGLALARPLWTREGLSASTVALLALATLATFVGAIGFAIARVRTQRAGWGALGAIGLAGLMLPFASEDSALRTGDAQSSSRQPVHAIFVIDNSRSMGTRTLGRTLLDVSKQRAAAYLAELPPGSLISVLPLCGPERSYSLDAHRHSEDARTAIERISITDRAGSALRMLALAKEAAERVTDLPAKHVVFLSDQQATNWPRGAVTQAAKSVGGPLQIVQIDERAGSATGIDFANVWCESFELQDGLAEPGMPASFLATLRSGSGSAATNVEVVLSVDGEELASQQVELRAGQRRDVVFVVPMNAAATSRTATLLPATLSLRVAETSGNRLERDDVRHLAVPVTTALPVVFVDQYGEEESLDSGQVGETYRLRRLLAPRPAEGAYESLVAVRRRTIEQLSLPDLEDARLVVVAGVELPTNEAVSLLRQYVEQGGSLVITAGANFDPAAWNEVAWLDGQGLLPLPLAATPFGIRPSQAAAGSRIEPFRLETSGLSHPFFQIEGESSESLTSLWSQPFFFQALAVDDSEETIRQAVEEEARRIAAERTALAAGASEFDLAPSWLLWKNQRRAAGGDNPDADRPGALSPDELAERSVPRVLARFAKQGAGGTGLPYLVERRLGYGRVLLLTAGISSDWDTLSQTNAIVLLDRITRSLLEETLPARNFAAGDTVTMPIERQSEVTYTVETPDGDSRPVPLDATGAGFVVRLEDTSIAGIYSVTTRRESGDLAEPIDRRVLAVNGPIEESDLTRLTATQLNERFGTDAMRFVGPNEAISFTGGTTRGEDLWRWLAVAVLACLLLEMAVAARWRADAAEVAR